VFDLLDKQMKLTGKQFWACRPCSTYATGMNHRLKQIEDDIKEVKLNTAINTEAIQNLEKRVEEVADIAKKSEGLSKEEMERRLKEEREEIRERKDRELNVIIHGLDECENQALSGAEKIDADISAGLRKFSEAGARVQYQEIKFCRRVGPRCEKARPLVMGFYSHMIRNRVLKADFNANGQGISVGPDMTKKQREEEAEIWKEKDAKNLNRTAEEKEKNLYWRLVGPKGDRRLVLGPARQPDTAGLAARGAGRGAMMRGRGRMEQRAATRGGVGRVGAGLGPVLLDSTRTEQEFRPRTSSKRKEPEPASRGEGEEEEEEDEETMEPPTKH
jgi:hypothetical protein